VVLLRIGGEIGNTASALCRPLGYDSGAMTRMIDRLIGLGLVQRVPCAQDGRVATLSLTPAGAALYPRLRPIAIEVLGEHLQGFAPEEIGQLMAYLERIAANGQPCNGRNPAGSPCCTATQPQAKGDV
ncbi:MAG TPA: MarR family transcriptional regulator, partial [Paenirhodobacter sp.]